MKKEITVTVSRTIIETLAAGASNSRRETITAKVPIGPLDDASKEIIDLTQLLQNMSDIDIEQVDVTEEIS